MKPRALALLAGAALVASGCAASADRSPGVVEAREELAALGPAAWKATADAATAAEGGNPEAVAPSASPRWREDWWEDFGDPRLGPLVGEALAANPDLRASAAAVAAAEADARIAGADLYPALAAGGQGGRSRQVFVGFPITGPGIQPPLSATATQIGVSLDVSWELDVWGRLRAGRDAAEAELEAAKATHDGARLSLAGQTAKAWFAVVEARSQLDLAEATLASYRATGEQVEARYRLGVRSPLDLRLSRTQVAGAEARVALRRSALERVARQLELLLGRYPAAEVAPSSAPPASSPVDLPAVPAGIPATLLERRPDLVRAAERVFAADRRVAAAKASLLPRLALTGSAGTLSDDFSHLLDGDFGVWSWAANFVQPVFQGGRLRAGVRRASAGADAAKAEYVSSVLAAFGEVETALADEAHLARLEDALARAAFEADAARVLAEERYRRGLEAYVTLLESQRASLDAHSTLLDARRRRLENRVDLVLALGGGFSRGEGP